MSDPIIVYDECRHIQCTQCTRTITDQCFNIECDQCSKTKQIECQNLDCTQCAKTKEVECFTSECNECLHITQSECEHIECNQCSKTIKSECNHINCNQCSVSQYVECSGTIQCSTIECSQCTECQTVECRSECFKPTLGFYEPGFEEQLNKLDPSAPSAAQQCYPECVTLYPGQIDYWEDEERYIPYQCWQNECGAECATNVEKITGLTEPMECVYSQCIQCSFKNSNCTATPVLGAGGLKVGLSQCTVNCSAKPTPVNCNNCYVSNSSYMLSAPQCTGTTSSLNCNKTATAQLGSMVPDSDYYRAQCSRDSTEVSIFRTKRNFVESAIPRRTGKRAVFDTVEARKQIKLQYTDKSFNLGTYNLVNNHDLKLDIEPGIKKIVIYANLVGLNTRGEPAIRLGSSGVFKQNNYISTTGLIDFNNVGETSDRSSFKLVHDTISGKKISGIFTLTSIDGVRWYIEGSCTVNWANGADPLAMDSICFCSGYVDLPGTLDSMMFFGSDLLSNAQYTDAAAGFFTSGELSIFCSKNID